MVASREGRLLCIALSGNAAALLLLGAFVGGWARDMTADVLPPYTQHVLVRGGRPPAEIALGYEDRSYIARLPGVRRLHERTVHVDTAHFSSGAMIDEAAARVYSTAFSWPTLAGYRVVRGRSWTPGEVAASAPVAMLSGAWPTSPPFVTVRGRAFAVVGILDGPDPLNGPAKAVWLPLGTEGSASSTSTYLVELNGEGDDGWIAGQIDQWFLMRYGTTAAGQSPVSVTTFAAARAQLDFLRRALFATLLAFCIIPSLLAGTGVAAMTRLAIQQRIPEIGLRRAVGATRQDILDLFVEEALVLARGATLWGCMLSGIGLAIGKALGWPIAPPVTMIIVAAVLPTTICFGFAIPPAVVAAHLDPSEALGVR